MSDASRLSLAELLDELGQLQEEATPGPWKMWGGWGPVVNDERQRMAVGRVGPDGGGGLTADLDRDIAPTRDIYGTRVDFELIAAAVNALPLLLSELSRLQEARDSGALEWGIAAMDAWNRRVPGECDNHITVLRALAGD